MLDVEGCILDLQFVFCINNDSVQFSFIY
jgi:hypothetical protein